MPFMVKSSKIGRAIFGGAGGYKRQKEEFVPLSATSRRNLDLTLSEMKVYNILQTSRSHDSESLMSRDYVDKHHDDKTTNKSGTESGKYYRSTSQGNDHHRRSSSQRMLLAFDQDEPVAFQFQRQNFPPDILDGKAADQVNLFHESILVGPSDSANNTNSGTRAYPRHLNLSRSRVMPTNHADDRAFDDIVTRNGDEIPTMQLSTQEPIAFSFVPTSSRGLQLDPPRSDKASISRNPPGSLTARISPTGDPVGGPSTFPFERRVIPNVEVPSSTTGSSIAVRPESARFSPLFSRLPSDTSPKYPIRRFNDGGELQAAPELSGLSYGAMSPPKHFSEGRRWSESRGPNGPVYPSRYSGSFEEIQECHASFVPTSARDSIVPAVQNQSALLKNRVGERVTSLHVETQRHICLETTPPRKNNWVKIPVEMASNLGAPCNPSGRRLTRHAWRQNSSPTELSVASATMPQHKAINDFDQLAERKPICSNPFVDSCTVQDRSYCVNATTTREQQQEQATNDFFELGKPLATLTSSVVEVPSNCPYPREPKCYGVDFGDTQNLMPQLKATDGFDLLTERKAIHSSPFKDSSGLPACHNYTFATTTREQQQEQLMVNLFDLSKPVATQTSCVVEALDDPTSPREHKCDGVDFNVTQRWGTTECIPMVGLPKRFEEKFSNACDVREAPACWPGASSVDDLFDDEDIAVGNLNVPMKEHQSSSMLDSVFRLSRAPLSEFRRVLNTDDPNQCTFWVTDALGQCHYLEIDVENAKPKSGEQSLPAGNEIIVVKDNRVQKSSPRLWNEGSFHFQGKGYGKVEDDAIGKSCLTPSNKQPNRRKVRASLSFRAQTTKGLLRRNFSFSSVR
jgi:hypothetical protein